MEPILADLKTHIEKTLEDLRHELSKIRTGRANLSIVDGVKVDYYGTPTPLSGVGTLNVADARLITIKPWDKTVIPAIEKAIHESGIGINPSNDGEMVRLPIPQLTEERRKEIAKQVKVKGEDHKIAVRNLRRDANEKLKEQEKNKGLSADDHKRGTERVQKETDAGIAKVDEIVARKEKEVLEV